MASIDEEERYSDSDFDDPDSQRESFNRSMSSISSEWTPLKYQLKKDFDDLNDKSQKKLVRKSLEAINSIFENIAPGQAEKLKKAFADPSPETFLTEALQNAIKSTSSTNT